MIYDRHEAVTKMEPLLLAQGSPQGSPHRPALTDLAWDLAQKSAGLRRSRPEPLAASLAELVRSMHCYYSNLIEGHDTLPIDIERALKDDFSQDAGKRDLQLDARAHIAVQHWIDSGALAGRAVSVDALCEIHRRFCEQLPADLLWLQEPGSPQGLAVIPGALRDRDVTVGPHTPISALAVPRFLQRFEQVYESLGSSETVLAILLQRKRGCRLRRLCDGCGWRSQPSSQARGFLMKP